jgi:radical SAM protein with 4Fe4S-binding SPASM domain
MKSNHIFSGLLNSIFNPPALPEPGIYHYPREENGGKTRIHLRVDSDRSGLLVVNANRVVQLNPSAAAMAYLHLENRSPKEAARVLRQQYQAKASRIAQDYRAFEDQIEQLLEPNGACPVCDLSLETTAPFSAKPSAPYRMDLALTYRCNNECAHCYNARSRRFPEMDVAAWKRVIDKVWELRIPHIVFTGGEPTLYQGLPELVAYAEQTGVITGLNTNGRKLANPDYLASLGDAGLDHVQITFESHDPAIHDSMVGAQGAWAETVAGLNNALDTSLYLMTNTTLLTHNVDTLQETLKFLGEIGVPTVGLNALIYAGKGKTVETGLKEQDLPELLELAHTLTRENQQRLIWYTPTQYCHFNPVQLGLGVKGCTAALYNMCVEPNGDVLPCQSYYQSLGNLLENDWASIWEHPLALSLRNRSDVPEGCQSCEFLPECGGGCPLAREHQNINPISNPVLQINHQ